MPFKILCSCGVALLAGDDLESYKLACPECGSYTLLPAIPDPYKLPSNAEMIPLEEIVTEKASPSRKESTVRSRGGVSSGGGGRRQRSEREMSETHVWLIGMLVVIVVIIAIVGLLYVSKM